MSYANCDIICFTLSRWDSAISSPALALAKEFAKNHRVFYVEHPYSWKDYYKEKHTTAIQLRKEALLKGKNIYMNPGSLPANITIVTPQLTLPVNFLPNGALYKTLAKRNDEIVLKAIRRTIKDFNIQRFVYINFFDPYFVRKLPADIQPLCTVYQSMDDISQVSYSNRHGTRLEEEIIRNFDITLCTSKELTRLKSPFNKNVFFHPNAADIAVFSAAVNGPLPLPEEIADISTPIIGYTGSIEYRSDFELLRKIALYHKDKTLVFVGPVQGNEVKEFGIDQLPNVRFIGPKRIEELPPFLQRFNCVIIPFKKNTLTKSIYPLKINEYLAAGKPVVATHFSEDIYSFRNVAYVADDHEAFLQAINTAISEDSDTKVQERVAVAAQNTWTARVAQFWDILQKNKPA